MMELLAHLAGERAIWDTRHPGALRCGAFFVDLDFPAPPPDWLAEGMRRVRVVKGARRPKTSAPASTRRASSTVERVFGR